MSQNIRPVRDPSRLPAIRLGAEAGVAQVLTPTEALALLDRLADAEAVEAIAADFVESARFITPDGWGLQDAIAKLISALSDRKTKPLGTTPTV